MEEFWLAGSEEIKELLVAIFAWVAKMESQRHSARVKAGVARLQAQGGHLGHLPGAKDRKKSGYYASWERERATGPRTDTT